MMASPTFDPTLDCYVATNPLTGAEVYGATYGACSANLAVSMEVAAKHITVNGISVAVAPGAGEVLAGALVAAVEEVENV